MILESSELVVPNSIPEEPKETVVECESLALVVRDLQLPTHEETKETVAGVDAADLSQVPGDNDLEARNPFSDEGLESEKSIELEQEPGLVNRYNLNCYFYSRIPPLASSVIGEQRAWSTW